MAVDGIRLKGIVNAALSSSTFGFAPLFTLLLLAENFTPFEVLNTVGVWLLLRLQHLHCLQGTVSG